MNRVGIAKISDFMKGKRVILMGNSPSVLKEKKNIDSYDVIIRLNNAYPRNNTEYIGSRTDIWIVGDESVDDNYRMKFDPVFTIRIKEDGNIDDNLHGKVCLYPQEIHSRLSNYLIDAGGMKPSTGASAIELLLTLNSFKELIICGIDFMKTADWTGNSLDREQMKLQDVGRFSGIPIEGNGWWHHNYIVEESYLRPILESHEKVIMI